MAPTQKGKRTRKGNACPFCMKVVKRICDHLVNIHPDEHDVKQISKLQRKRKRTKDKAVRLAYLRKIREGCNSLVGQGNLKYNKANRKSMIKKYHKTSGAQEKVKLVPCNGCGHMYRKWGLARHKCTSSDPSRSVSAAYVDFNLAIDVSDTFRTEVLERLRDDNIKEIILREVDILGFGGELVDAIKPVNPNKAPPATIKDEYTRIRQDLRRLANYLLCCRHITGSEELSLVDTFSKKDKLLEITAKYSKDFDEPEGLVKLMGVLKHFTELLLMNMDIDDPTSYNKLKMQFEQFRLKWTYVVQKQIGRAKGEKELEDKNKTLYIPEAEDIKKVNTYISERLDEILNGTIDSYSEYLELGRLLVTKITLFNYRRGNEVAKMTLHQFSRKEISQKSPSKSIKLDKIERVVAKFLPVVTLKGKSQNHQTVLAYLEPVACTGIDVLLKAREKFVSEDPKDGIGENNPFVFATKGGKEYHLGGYKSLEKCIEAAKLPENFIKSFNFRLVRIYVSTEFRWMNASEDMKIMLCKQLGHLVKTHERNYIQELRTPTGKFHKIPAMLVNMAYGREHGKKVHEVEESDVLRYLNSIMKEKKSTSSADTSSNMAMTASTSKAGTSNTISKASTSATASTSKAGTSNTISKASTSADTPSTSGHNLEESDTDTDENSDIEMGSGSKTGNNPTDQVRVDTDTDTDENSDIEKGSGSKTGDKVRVDTADTDENIDIESGSDSITDTDENSDIENCGSSSKTKSKPADPIPDSRTSDTDVDKEKNDVESSGSGPETESNLVDQFPDQHSTDSDAESNNEVEESPAPSNEKRRQVTWTRTMNQIVADVFRDEIRNKSTTVTKVKVLECMKRFKKAKQKEVSYSAVKSTVSNILRGRRKLFTW